jgi:hypothetical protein
MSATAPLDRYIRRVLGDEQAKVSSHNPRPTPTLVQGKVARILTYRGCFNPPRQGHKDALCHDFFRGGDNLNMIAAIVYFLDDYSVRAKYYKGADGIEPSSLTQHVRIKLFNGGAFHGGWHYCYPCDIGVQYNFQNKLRQEAALDGFQIQLLTLAEPDHFGLVHDERIYMENTIILGTGYPERTQFRAETENGLRHLRNYSDWRMFPLTETDIQAFGTVGWVGWLERKLGVMFTENAIGLPDETEERELAVKLRLQKKIWHLEQIRECHHVTGPVEQWIRFVSIKFFGMKGEASFLGYLRQEKQLSSIRIRHILAHAEDEQEMIKALFGITLRPTHLFSYVRRHKEDAAHKSKHKQTRDGGEIQTRHRTGRWVEGRTRDNSNGDADGRLETRQKGLKTQIAVKESCITRWCEQ